MVNLNNPHAQHQWRGEADCTYIIIRTPQAYTNGICRKPCLWFVLVVVSSRHPYVHNKDMDRHTINIIQSCYLYIMYVCFIIIFFYLFQVSHHSERTTDYTDFAVRHVIVYLFLMKIKYLWLRNTCLCIFMFSYNTCFEHKHVKVKYVF